jgi:hypothetical protein
MFKEHKKSGLYVSENGEVQCRKSTRTKKLGTSTSGYSQVSFNGKTYLVHRLVWETFKGEIEKGLCINHLNGIKSDNRLVNLEKVTYKENFRHGMSNGLINPSSPAELNGNAKLTNQQYYQIIELIMAGKPNSFIAKTFNLHERYISLIRGKKRLTSIWEQYEAEHGVSPIPMSGEQSKLTLQQRVELIKQLSMCSNKALADQYNLDPSIVSNVRYRKTWLKVWEIFDKKCNDHSERK